MQAMKTNPITLNTNTKGRREITPGGPSINQTLCATAYSRSSIHQNRTNPASTGRFAIRHDINANPGKPT
jgi:hypothetical protein